jgi:hypothetical protein
VGVLLALGWAFARAFVALLGTAQSVFTISEAANPLLGKTLEPSRAAMLTGWFTVLFAGLAAGCVFNALLHIRHSLKLIRRVAAIRRAEERS